MRHDTTSVKIRAKRIEIRVLVRISRNVERRIRDAYDRLVELEHGA